MKIISGPVGHYQPTRATLSNLGYVAPQQIHDLIGVS